MFALILALLLCSAAGVGVVVFAMVEARREGRGGFWTPEGEELIAGARRTGQRVRHRGEELGRGAAVRTQALRERRRGPDRSATGPDDDTHLSAAS
jgi:hypothetical protein